MEENIKLMTVKFADGAEEERQVEFVYDKNSDPPYTVKIEVYCTESWELAGDIYLAVRRLAQKLDQVDVIQLHSFAGFWGDQVLYERDITDNINGKPEIPDLPF